MKVVEMTETKTKNKRNIMKECHQKARNKP